MPTEPSIKSASTGYAWGRRDAANSLAQTAESLIRIVAKGNMSVEEALECLEVKRLSEGGSSR
jgi:hypothetical protein